MCDYQYRELGCGHVYHIVLQWCEQYPRTAKPCPPNITNFEYRAHETCTECKPRTRQPWEDLLTQNKSSTTTAAAAGQPFKV